MPQLTEITVNCDGCDWFTGDLASVPDGCCMLTGIKFIPRHKIPGTNKFCKRKTGTWKWSKGAVKRRVQDDLSPITHEAHELT